MATTTIRVSLQTRKTVQTLAQATGVSMQQVIDQALELYRRQQLLLETNRAYARLRKDEEAWDAFTHELAQWDKTLADGIEKA
jgi:predicted transcriptional regulator